MLNNIVYIYRNILHKYKLILLFNLICSLSIGTLPLLTLYITKKIMNALLINEKALANILVLVIFMYLFQYILILITYLNSMAHELFSYIMQDKMSIDIFEKIKKIDLEQFDRQEYYDLYDKVCSEGNKNPLLIFEDLFQLFQSILQTVIYLIILVNSKQLLIGQKIIIFLVITTAIYFRKILLNKEYELNILSFEETIFSKRKSIVLNNLLNSYSNHDELKIFHAFSYFKKLIEHSNYETFKLDKHYKYKIHNFNRLGAVISLIVKNIAYLMLLQEVFYKRMTYGDYVLLFGSIEGVFNSIMLFSSYYSSLFQNLYYFNYIKEFYNREDKIYNSGNIELAEFNEIEFLHVFFKYPGMDDYIINDISFNIKKGETVGIIGLNASGKSTVLKLLMRLYDVEKGKILINHIDIKDYNCNSLYQLFGVVFQDFCKYSVSIREFVMGGDLLTEGNKCKMETALKKAGLFDFVNTLPLKSNTLLTKEFSGDAIDFSLGQWQKINIARMFYNKRKVIALDEPSASLDIISEYNIFNDLKNKDEDETIIFVTHNLSNVKQCSNIIFLSQGKIIAQGNHSFLEHNCKEYKDLFHSQLSRFK